MNPEVTPDPKIKIKTSSLSKPSLLRVCLDKLGGLSKTNCLKNSTSKVSSLFAKIITPKLLERLEYVCVLMPGLFFISLGVSALLSPQYLRLLAAGFCISFGILFCTSGIKFLALKRKISKFSHQIEARLIIDPGKGSDLHNFEKFEPKKEFFH